MIQWLLITHKHMNFDVAKEGQKYVDKLEMMENLRRWINDYLHGNQGKLSPKKKAQLLKIKKRLPNDTLSDRIKLMEITELFNFQEPEDYHGNWNGKHLNQLIGRFERNVKKLKAIDDEMMLLISHIHDLHSYIEYVKRAGFSKARELSLLKRVNWSVRKTKPNIPDMSFILKLDHKKDLVPDMYHYLDA
ncbi:uncharacterized protein LOC117792175 [Drosophila innubila]|uniref:uncharacterized protein LOC117792175 n=1 Tax=Drosophila innubila TaxID=198719 RepID=UPI00148DA018|nr:uncharacterized protein LOC117792175 [Drosophila innubila]